MAHSIIRYTLTGAIGTIAHYIVLFSLLLVHFSATFATACGATVGAAINYLLCRHWVFSANDTPLWSGASRFFAIAALCVILNAIVMANLSSHIGVWITQFIATALTLLIGFVLNRFWTFQNTQDYPV